MPDILHAPLRRRPASAARRIALALAASALGGLSTSALAQMPGVPTLQNAWANAGFVAGLNAGTGGGSSAVAAAVSWAPQNGRFQVSGGAGVRDADEQGNGATYGLRAALPIFGFRGGSLGVAGFIGIGGAREPDAVIGFDEGGTLTHVPIGVAVGYRRALNFVRGVSVYASPYYSYNRLSVGDFTNVENLFRVGVGIDVGLTRSIGVTLGSDFGSSADEGQPGPDGAMFGIGASYAFGRR